MVRVIHTDEGSRKEEAISSSLDPSRGRKGVSYSLPGGAPGGGFAMAAGAGDACSPVEEAAVRPLSMWAIAAEKVKPARCMASRPS